MIPLIYEDPADILCRGNYCGNFDTDVILLYSGKHQVDLRANLLVRRSKFLLGLSLLLKTSFASIQFVILDASLCKRLSTI